MKIEINITEQTLTLFEGDKPVKKWPVSTAKNGPGELLDSECTPRGHHIIAEKIGDGCEINTIFVGRRPIGEIYHPVLRQQFPERDWILTRILWLKGTDAGFNLGGNRDSHERYIYIHGCPDEIDMSKPSSRGCIRMRNSDVIELFDQVDVGTIVWIIEN